MIDVAKALSTVLGQPKNVRIFKKHIDRLAIGDEDELARVVYQIVGDILTAKNNLKSIISNVKNHRIGWEHTTFNEVKKKLEEHDDYLVNPFEVAEGIAECGKCGSTRTFSVQKQCRSSDEPMTTFSQCVECGNTWTYDG